MLAYLAFVFVLALIVIGQGLPRGVASIQTASPEARLFDSLALTGILVVGAVFTVALMLHAHAAEKQPRPTPRGFRLVLILIVVLTIALALFCFGVAGAMGWHSFGPGI